MQWVGWHLVRPEITPDLVVAPVRQRIELGQPVLGVEFLDRQVAARDRLRAALAADPCVPARERPRQRRRLADGAATLAEFDAPVERVDTVAADIRFQRPGVGVVHLDRQVIVFAHPIHQRVGFPRQPSGVERENRDRQRVLGNDVVQHHVLGTEAAREGASAILHRDSMEQGGQIGEATIQAHGWGPAEGNDSGASCARRRRNSGTGRANVPW